MELFSIRIQRTFQLVSTPEGKKGDNRAIKGIGCPAICPKGIRPSDRPQRLQAYSLGLFFGRMGQESIIL